jgi:TonB family protein
MAALSLSVASHLVVGVVLLAAVLWGSWNTPRVHVVNLVPAVAAVGAPGGEPAPPTPAPPPPRAPAPPEPRPAPAPPRAAPEPPPRSREALTLPAAPPRPAPLPPRPAALPRPGEKELPSLAQAARPATPAPAPERAAELRPTPPPPPAPLGQATGATTGSGGLTLDVSDFPHAWYLRQVLRKVEEQWQRQGLSHEPAQKPMVLVEIQRNGAIQVPRIEKTSGNASYDQAALRAIMDASPFPELPRDWPRPVLRVMFRFDLKQG